MDVEKVHLTKEHETYLSTLYGKAMLYRVLGRFGWYIRSVQHLRYEF